MKTKATYEKVIAAIDKLQSNHQDVTLDAILSFTGGSKGTVFKHWNRYKEEHRTVEAIDGELSAVVQNAIMAEIGTKLKAAKKRLETDLSEEKTISLSLAESNEKQDVLINELQEKTSDLERMLAKLQGRYDQADKEAQMERNKSEEFHTKLTEIRIMLSLSEDNTNTMEKKIAENNSQLTLYHDKATQSEKQEAVATQQVLYLNKRLNEQIEFRQQQTVTLVCAEETIEKQNEELKKIERARAQAEQAAVIAQVKLEHLNKERIPPEQAH